MNDDPVSQRAGGGKLAPTDIEHFKARLEAQRETLQRQIASLEQTMASPGAYEDSIQERGDDALFLRGRDDIWDQLHFARDELARVDRALARIVDGTYGVSEVSGKPIPRERLEALPSATTLVDETPAQ
jgi:RNA polymerase-binding transcription factor DksA